MFQDKILQSVANAVKDVVAEQLKGDQHKIDKNKNGKIDAHDFKLLRKEEAPKKPASPFDWKNTPRQTAEKGEKTGHDAKKISTGTVYTKKYTKEEASQAEFNAEIKKAQDKSTGKIKADVAKPAVQAVRVEEGFFDSLKRGYTTGLQTGLKKKIKPEHHSSYDIAGVKSTSDATSILQKAKQAGHHINEEVEQIDELSKKTLKSYKKAATSQVMTAFNRDPSDYYTQKMADKMDRRADNIGTAAKKLDKIKKMKKKLKEDVQQIDELSKSTLGSYIKKASHDVAHKGAMTRQHANDSEAARKDSRYNDARKSMEKADKTFAKSWKRREGMAKATDRLTKEEVEKIDEVSLALAKRARDKASDIALRDRDSMERDKPYGHSEKQRVKFQRYVDKKAPSAADAVDRLTKEEVEIIERSLTADEKAAMEKNVKGMKKNLAGFKERYGKDAKSVMYATATANAKKD